MLTLIGIGNSWRGDDAVGLFVAEQLGARRRDDIAVIVHEGEPIELIDTLALIDEVWLIDAVASNAAPGTIHRLDASASELPAGLFGISTHRFGLPETLELARALGGLPARVRVYGIEGDRFDTGGALSPAVHAAAAALTTELLDEVAACAR
jgi:hydrogenase maturation protease